MAKARYPRHGFATDQRVVLFLGTTILFFCSTNILCLETTQNLPLSQLVGFGIPAALSSAENKIRLQLQKTASPTWTQDNKNATQYRERIISIRAGKRGTIENEASEVKVITQSNANKAEPPGLLSKACLAWRDAPKELRFALSFLGIFGSFLYWGYLQERITGHEYISSTQPLLKQQWHFPFVLNTFMAFSGLVVGTVLQFFTSLKSEKLQPDFKVRDFLRPAVSYTLGSPFGYTALRFINFPMLILAKSCKLIPVMLMGFLIAGKRYQLSEYFAVSLITVGIALYSLKPGSTVAAAAGGWRQLFGLGLVLVNLLLDGYTAAHQDKINARSNASSFQMMKFMNLWSLVTMVLILTGGAAVFGSKSELIQALTFCRTFPEVVPHLCRFGLCAAAGQVFVYFLIKEFGALAYITVTIMRKFFTVLISIAVFKHKVTWWQWIGILSVFGGLLTNVYGKNS